MSDYYLGTMCGTSLDAFDVSVLKTTKTNFYCSSSTNPFN